jgi:hypothetical protein
MLLTLLLSPQNVGFGLGQALACFFFGPFVLWFSYRWVRRGLRLVKSEWPEEKKTGWAFLALAFVVVTGFYYATRPPYLGYAGSSKGDGIELIVLVIMGIGLVIGVPWLFIWSTRKFFSLTSILPSKALISVLVGLLASCFLGLCWWGLG